jgi:hypothetical protein
VELGAIPFGFIAELPSELSKSRVRDYPSKPTVFEQPFHMEFFDDGG